MNARVVYSTTTGAIRMAANRDVEPGPGEAVLDVQEVIRPSRYRVDLDTLALVAVERPGADPLLALRRARNALLAKSDWTQLADAPLTVEQKTEATVYRQALRDAPAVGHLPTMPEFMRR